MPVLRPLCPETDPSRWVFAYDPLTVVTRMRLGVGAFLAVLAVIGVLAVPSIALQFKHSRDEGAFQTNLAASIGAWSDTRNPEGPARDTAWATANPGLALAEGDRACAWLAGQPDAPGRPDPSGRQSQETLQNRWISARGNVIGPLSWQGQSHLVAGAWTHLCWWDLHQKTAPLSAVED